MKKAFIFCLLVTLGILISCKKSKEDIIKEDPFATNDLDSINLQMIRSLGEVLSPDTRLKVTNWAAYQDADQLIEKFYAMSATEVLFTAEELKNTTKILKDSIKDDRFKEIGIRTRINVIHNCALRLADMANIPNISASEVNDETQKMLNAFSSLNAKLNNITVQEQIEAQVSDIEQQLPKKN